jgi:polar amino acid transport system substrate-binding protein
MKKGITILVIFTLVLISVQAQELKLMTEQNAPFSFDNGSGPQGIAIDLLDEVLKRAGRSEDVDNAEYLPWARAYNKIQQESGTVLFPMARTDSRESLFKWVGPIYGLKIGIIAKKSANVSISGTSDFSRYIIGTIREGAPEQMLIEAGADVSSLDRGANLNQGLLKLKNNRIQAFAFNVPAALYNLKEMGEDPADYEVVYTLKDLEIYYAFNKSTSNSIISQLQSAIDSVRSSGKYDQIVNNYLK